MRRWAPVLAILATLAFAGSAEAAWQASGPGSSYAKGRSIPAGNTPSATVSGRNITVTWSAAGGSVPLDGYVVRRFDTGGSEAAVGSACSGTINALSCTESSLAPGDWRYTVTPIRQNWSGAQSGQSTAVTVGSPALSLSPGTVNALPATLTGSISNFKTGQTVSFRLDDPTSGTVLTGSIVPTPVPANGIASVSVTLPAATSNASHTIYAIGSSGDQASAAVTVARPLVTSSVIAKTAGGDSGFVKQNGTYFVYANVSGAGSPPTGLSTLTADVSNVTTGQTAVAMNNGSFTIDGQTYNYRSNSVTAGNPLSAGSKGYSLTLTDTAGSTTLTNHTVTVDNTAPAGSDIQTANVGTAGTAELGDSITYTYTEPIDANSILAGWAGPSTNVVLHLNDGGLGNDTVTIFDSTNATQLPLGSVNLNSLLYTLANRTFGATGTPSTMVRSGSTVTVTLGTASGAVGNAVLPSAMNWTPSASATDRAGNAAATTGTPESGGADVNF